MLAFLLGCFAGSIFTMFVLAIFMVNGEWRDK